MGLFKKVKPRAVEAGKDLRKAQETIAVSGSSEKMLSENVSFLTEELSSVRVGRANHRADFDETTARVQQMKREVEK